MNSIDKETFRSVLLNWFQKNARDLPWRKEPTIYKTIISEFMLQQTQVKTVLPYFERWMKRYPDMERLAKADISEVIVLWSGLGYYSRAKNLHSFAQQFIKEHPSSYKELLKYKGIGSYTAAAIASIAYKEAVAVVDGNVVRVLARLENHQDLFKSKDLAIQWAMPLAQSLVDPNYPGDFNEAMMEIGATVCSKQNPHCMSCPLHVFCKAYQAKAVEQCPRFLQPQYTSVEKKRLYISHNGNLLLELSKIGNYSLLELPELTKERQVLLPQLSHLFTGKRSIGTVTYTEKIYRIPKNISPVELLSQPSFKSCKYYEAKNLENLPLSGPHKRWIKKLIQQKLL